MINPAIFRWFKIALKWEIIIICASFAFIMPWQPAHAWSTATVPWSGGYTVLPEGMTADQFCRYERNPPLGNDDRACTASYYDGGTGCRYKDNTSPSSCRYPDGNKISTFSEYDPNESLPWFDIDGEPLPGNPDYDDGQVNCEADKLIEGVGYPSSSNHSAPVSYGGCQAVPVGASMCRVDTTEPGGWRCVGDLRLTGNPAAPEGVEVDDSPDISADPTEDVSGSESSDTDTEPTITQPDGTTIDVTTHIDTEVADSGVSISENQTHIIIVESDGVTTETETVVTVTVNPDGSYSEKTDTTVTITNPGGVRTRINKSDGSVTVETIPAGSRTDTTTRTDYYDSDGRKTGSTGSSGSSGDGPVTVPGIGSGDGGGGGQGGDGDGLGAFCDWADIVCQLADWFLDEPLYPDNPEVPFTEIDLSDIDGFDSGIGVGQCPADNVINTRFGAVPISWALPCQLAETFRPIVLFFAWITALYIVVRVK